MRGSTGYDRDFREKFLMDWGGGDLDDLSSAVDDMKSLRFVAQHRFGIWGSSNGGTLAVYSLRRKPGLFQAGVAGAPATDPTFFGSDEVAIARRPQTHPQTFTRGALQYAGNLRDHLLIIRGMEDDVVPVATRVALAEAFMRLGQEFRLRLRTGCHARVDAAPVLRDVSHDATRGSLRPLSRPGPSLTARRPGRSYATVTRVQP